jgi:dinuclear metal center YbgI/SA1388 family protein
MATVDDVIRFLDDLAPPVLAESWDNVGLLVGRRGRSVERVMTCLTITPDSAVEAVERGADLIVSHHPLPFRPLKTLTDGTSEGRLLLQLIEANVAVFSAHTAFDSAPEGINQRWAIGLQLKDIAPLVPTATSEGGGGRFGRLPSAIPLSQLAAQVKTLLAVEHVQAIGHLERSVQNVAVACGSAAEFLAPAHVALCDCLITGEARFHACLEAESLGMGLVLAGHFASERFAVEALAGVLEQSFPALQVWASQRERDPLHWL